MRIDSYALTGHQKCPAWYDLRIVKGWRSRTSSPALKFGQCVHVGLAVWHDVANLGEAVNALTLEWNKTPDVAFDDHRTLGKAVELMTKYTQHYPSETFAPVRSGGKALIEVPFVLDTGIVVDGEPLEYGGIFDALVEFNGQLYVVDHKTCSQLGPRYFDQFKPNNQITGYIWAAQALSGRRVAGAIINALCVTRAGNISFNRGITTRNEADIARWLADLEVEADNIASNKRRNHFPMRTASCTMFGLCEFHKVHVLAHEKEQLSQLDVGYVVDPWDFERRDDNTNNSTE